MASGSTSGSVSIQRRIWGVSQIPTTVSTRPPRKLTRIFVWMARSTRAVSFAPKQLEITTPAPSVKPSKKLTSRKISGPDELTAASASSPKYRPTMSVSAVL